MAVATIRNRSDEDPERGLGWAPVRDQLDSAVEVDVVPPAQDERIQVTGPLELCEPPAPDGIACCDLLGKESGRHRSAFTEAWLFGPCRMLPRRTAAKWAAIGSDPDDGPEAAEKAAELELRPSPPSPRRLRTTSPGVATEEPRCFHARDPLAVDLAGQRR